MNPYVYNPAYVGVEGHAALFLMYRPQWTNIEGAPETSHASFHVPLKGGIAFGASAFNTTQGLLSTSAAKITGGYLLNIDRTHFIRFGLSIGGGINAVNITEFDSPEDPAFDNFLEQNSFLIGDFGLTYHFGHFNIGFAIPNLFTYDVVTQTDFAPISITPLDNVLFKLNYRGHINDDFAIEPHLIYRYSQVSPSQYEGTIIAHLKHIIWVGASYRQDAGLIGLIGTKVKEKFGVGFSYELGNPDISTELGPTFEINIGYHLGIKKEHAEHVSSFIKSHRLSAEERAKKAALERQKQLDELKESRNQVADSKNPDENTLDIVSGDSTTNTNQTLSSNNLNNEFNNSQQNKTSTKNNFNENENSDNRGLTKNNFNQDENLDADTQFRNNQINNEYVESNPIEYENTTSETAERERGNPELTTDFRTHKELGASNTPLVVKRGNHLLELPTGSFVIAGAFEIFEHAENYSDDLFELGFHDTIVGFSSARGYYYVVVFQSTSVNHARRKRDDMRKTRVLSNAWVLQVTE